MAITRTGLLLAAEAYFFLGGCLVSSARKNSDSGAEQASKPVSDEDILKVAKEVVVKFIEGGRLSPANFNETFQAVFKSIRDTVRS